MTFPWPCPLPRAFALPCDWVSVLETLVRVVTLSLQPDFRPLLAVVPPVVSDAGWPLSIAAVVSPLPIPGNGRFGHAFPWSWEPSPLTPKLFAYPYPTSLLDASVGACAK